MWGLDKTIRERLLSYRRLVVGFSGGLDSSVLLHLVASDPLLFKKILAVHVHHGLSVHADAWQKHCQLFCNKKNIPYQAKAVFISSSSNLEEVARDARYRVFQQLIQPQDALLLAHHQDDQAETVLLNLLRGAGIDGLAAMPMLKPFGLGCLERPLLNHARAALKQYATAHQLDWIEDESNQDIHFSRNYLRHEILPRLTLRWPGAVASLSLSASHAAKARESLNALAYLDCNALALNPFQLALKPLYKLPDARIAQVIRIWLRQQGLKSPETRVLNTLIQAVVFARRDASPCLRLGQSMVRRYRDCLYILPVYPTQTKNLPQVTPGLLEAQGLFVPQNAKVSIQLRKGGEQMRWRGHTKSLKKIFQTLGVPPWLRDTIPLIFVDNSLAAVLDFAVADAYLKKDVYDTI